MRSGQGQASWFDKLPAWKQNTVCIIILYALLLVFFNKIVFSDMIFSQGGDTAAHESWASAIKYLETQYNIEPMWIPYVFGGMPLAGTLIFPHQVNVVQEYAVAGISKILFVGTTLHWLLAPFLLLGISVFFLGRTLKFSAPVSLFAALVVMLNPFTIGLPETGHGSKLIVLGYIPLLFLLTYKLFELRSLLMLGLTAATVGTMLLSSHPQMAFYGLLLIGSYLLYEIIIEVKQNPKGSALKVLLFVLAVCIGFGIYAYQALPTLEYSHYSIRGGSGGGAGGAESGSASGVSYEFATNWSFHPFEMINFLIPSFFGYESPYYWGWMPFTNSTVYIGLLPLLLAILAIIVARNKFTWFLLILSIVVLFVSFGKHFSIVYDLMFNYFPYFNKFRVPVMIMHLMPITLGLLSAFGLEWLLVNVPRLKEQEIQVWKKRLMKTVIALAAFVIVGLVFNEGIFNSLSGSFFAKEGEPGTLRQYGIQTPQAFLQFKKMRFDLMWKDFIKFAIIFGVCLGLFIAFLQKKIKPLFLMFVCIVILIIDLGIYDMKYINPKPNNALEQQFVPDATVQKLQADGASEQFRIFPLGELFQDNSFMYHHVQSIGGYSPAKLKIYQEMLDSCLYRGSDPQFPINMNVINMLNTKYLVAKGSLPEPMFTLVNADQAKGVLTYQNPGALPRAWFADEVTIAGSRQEVFAKLNSAEWNPRHTAILEKTPAEQITRPESASVKFSRNSNDEFELSVYTSSPSILVISEIYYPAGWKAFIDGTETEIYKTNYLLRSVIVPAGTHKVQFTFQPDSYQTGLTVTRAAWGVTLLLILAGVFLDPNFRSKLGLGKKKVEPEKTM